MELYTNSSDDYDNFIVNTLGKEVFNLDFKNNSNIEKYGNKQFENYLTIMRRHDINRNIDKRNKHEKSHVTHNDYDKKLQIQTLLTIKYVVNDNIVVFPCIHIKRMTLQLNYQWQYSQYC